MADDQTQASSTPDTQPTVVATPSAAAPTPPVRIPLSREHYLRRWAVLFSIAALVLLADQLSKAWVLANLSLGETRTIIPALAPFFQLTRSENTGSAFGFLPQAGSAFLVMALIIIVGMAIFYPRLSNEARLTRIGLALVMGGALGNALDRVQQGAVIDFIHYTLPGVISNVSNIADHAIVIGVILTFIDAWRTDTRRNRE